MRVARMVICLALLLAPLAVHAGAQPPSQPTPPGQEEFVPLSEIPPEEQIPAFTLLASAYGFVWLALVAYVWSVSRRLHRVESEIAALTRSGGGRP
jgi:CcmD family protein